jgi:hypothetical protein
LLECKSELTAVKLAVRRARARQVLAVALATVCVVLCAEIDRDARAADNSALIQSQVNSGSLAPTEIRYTGAQTGVTMLVQNGSSFSAASSDYRAALV